MRSLSDGEREIWNDSQRDDGAPDWKTLSETRHTRRKGPVDCDGCHEVIEIGQRYKIVTALEDGSFIQMRLHEPVCPKFQRVLSEGDGPDWTTTQPQEAWKREHRPIKRKRPPPRPGRDTTGA